MSTQDVVVTAFPFTGAGTEGMTLRDYFAAKAMQGFATKLGPEATFETRASVAYQWADAMLKAREA